MPKDFDKALEYWQSIRSDEDAQYDDEIVIDGSQIEPMVTWGINPGVAFVPTTDGCLQLIHKQLKKRLILCHLKKVRH